MPQWNREFRKRSSNDRAESQSLGQFLKSRIAGIGFRVFAARGFGRTNVGISGKDIRQRLELKRQLETDT